MNVPRIPPNLQAAVASVLVNARLRNQPVTPHEALREARHIVDQANLSAYLERRSAEGLERSRESIDEDARIHRKLFTQPRRKY